MAENAAHIGPTSTTKTLLKPSRLNIEAELSGSGRKRYNQSWLVQTDCASVLFHLPRSQIPAAVYDNSQPLVYVHDVLLVLVHLYIHVWPMMVHRHIPP